MWPFVAGMFALVEMIVLSQGWCQVSSLQHTHWGKQDISSEDCITKKCLEGAIICVVLNFILHNVSN